MYLSEKNILSSSDVPGTILRALPKNEPYEAANTEVFFELQKQQLQLIYSL